MRHNTNVGRLDMHVNKKGASVVSREENAPLEIFQRGLEMNLTPCLLTRQATDRIIM